MLAAMQILFGIDNALFITLEANKLDESKRKFARNLGVILAGVGRVVLLVLLLWGMKSMMEPFFSIDTTNFKGDFSLKVMIMFGGGIFLIFESIFEMFKLSAQIDHAHGEASADGTSTLSKIVVRIVIINVIFSVDSILTAIALTESIAVMVAAIGLSVILMIALAEKMAMLLQKFEIFTFTGLQVLTFIGIILIGEGAHAGHIELFGWKVEPVHSVWMFTLVVLFVIQDLCLFRKHSLKRTKNAH
jgi:predicted tellurium resistance membrane protein TerC